MNFLWGMIPQLEASAGVENPNQISRRVARELGLAGDGDFIIMVRGFNADPQWNTPSITLLQV